MADIKAPGFGKTPRHMDAHGNALIETYSITANALINDKLYFGIIPAGTRVVRVRSVNEATAASVVMDLGYEPVNAALGPTAAPAYFMDNADIAAAGADESIAFPILFEHPVYLVGLITGANFGAAKRVDVSVLGQAVGVK